MYHPWRHLRSRADWLFTTERLPEGVQAMTRWATRTIILRPGLRQAERRAALAHELVHVERGPFPAHLAVREERAVEREAARRLIGISELGEAMAWASSLHELAEELWVDEVTVRARLDGLHPAERHYLRARLSHREEEPS